MSRFLCSRLAIRSISKNKQIYLPYILTCTLTISLFYILCSLLFNESLTTQFVSGSNVAYITLSLALILSAIFALIFLFYTNSFLIKQRKKEFGLYNILGLEKNHIFKIVTLETIYIFVASIIAGLLIGILFEKLMLLILLNLIDLSVSIGPQISLKVILLTISFFGFIFILIALSSIYKISRSSPMDMLKSQSMGDKEPKAKRAMAIIGILLLIAGYTSAVFVSMDKNTLVFFLGSAILVILGTYFLFTAGSIALLKLLRKNKKFYYKTKHFISVSNMMHRMKRNAVGLASICVLSSIVLSCLTVTFSLWQASDQIVRASAPSTFCTVLRGYDKRDFSGNAYDTCYSIEDLSTKKQNIKDVIQKGLTEKNINSSSEIYGEMHLLRKTNTFSESDIHKVFNRFEHLITIDDYNLLNNQSKTLNDGEVLTYYDPNSGTVPPKCPANVSVLGKNFCVKEKLDRFDGLKSIVYHNSDFDKADYGDGEKWYISPVVVVKDSSVIDDICKSSDSTYLYSKDILYGVNFSENRSITSDACFNIGVNLREQMPSSYSYNQQTIKGSVMEGFGGFLFVGIFLSFLFMIATALVIYYKQVAEAYEDKKRFKSMQSIGVSKKEISHSVKAQILTMFFLPLACSGINLAFTFPFIYKFIEISGLTDPSYLMVCMLSCFIPFSILYILIYAITSKIYYKIIS